MNSLYHESIAILKRKAVGIQKDTSSVQWDYLVLRDDRGEYHFLDLVNRAIGAGFDLTAMATRIVNYFDLPDDEFAAKEFFRQSREGTGATAYSFLLSASQEEAVNAFVKLDGGKNALWVNEALLPKYLGRWRTRQRFLFERGFDSFTKPSFSPQLRTNIRNIVKAKTSGRLVVFAGAGVSIDSNVPGWSSLLAQLRADLGQVARENDALAVPQRYLRERRKKEYQERIQEVLHHPQTRFNPLHQKILELRPQHILTTNYDPHFEQAILESSHRYSIVKKDSDLPYSKGGSLLVKMHGDFSERNIVLAEEDYVNYRENFPLVESFVKAVFSSSLILFVGFSFTDPNLKEILGRVREILKADSQPPYLLIIPSAASTPKSRRRIESELKRLETEELRAVIYEPKSIEKYFDQVRSPQDEKRLKLLGKTGQNLYRFLKVIELFDLTSDAIDSVDVGEQLTLSLRRFNELGAIPIDTIKRLVPFRLRGQSKYSDSSNAEASLYEPFVLETKNEELLTYLKTRSRKGVVTFTSDNSDKAEGADEAFRLLHASAVTTIARGNDTRPEVYNLNPTRVTDECRCMSCLYQRLELWDLLQDGETLATKCISGQEQVDIGVKQAWAFFKMGQPVRSYYVLEELKVRAKREQRYVTYYLACHNQMNLRPYLRHQPNTPTKELDQIRASIHDVDLDRLLHELPVDEDVRAALLSLRLDKGIDAARGSIREALENIRKTYTGYKQGTLRIHSGPLYWHLAEASAYVAWNLLRRNHLLDDEYGEFRGLMESYLDCMFLSWATSPEYKPRPTSLSEFFAYVFTEYGSSKWLLTRVDDLGIRAIQLNDVARKKVLSRFANFLSSGFEKQKFLGTDILKRQLFDRACESIEFQSRVRDLMNNHLLLISLLDLNKDEARSILDQVLNFLSVSDCFGQADSHTIFLHFVNAISNKLEGDDLDRLVQYALSENIWTRDVLPDLYEIINGTSGAFKAKKGTYADIVARTHRKDWKTELTDAMPLYQFLPAEEQQQLKSSLALERVAENRIAKVLQDAYYFGLWSPSSDPKYWSAYCTRLAKELVGLRDYAIDDNGRPINIQNFGPWNGIRNCIRVAYEHQLRDSQECDMVMAALKSDMFKWALRPESFDYSRFSHRWLLAFEDWFLERMTWTKPMTAAIESGLKREFLPRIAEQLYKHLATGNATSRTSG